MSSHDHLLFFQLFGDIFGRRSRNFDPSLGEEGAGTQHEDNVQHGVDGILRKHENRVIKGESNMKMMLKV